MCQWLPDVDNKRKMTIFHRFWTYLTHLRDVGECAEFIFSTYMKMFHLFNIGTERISALKYRLIGFYQLLNKIGKINVVKKSPICIFGSFVASFLTQGKGQAQNSYQIWIKHFKKLIHK